MPNVLLSEPKTLIRDWGEEILLIWRPTYCAKLLKRKAGTKGNLQYHVKEESHYLLSGRLLVRWDPGTGQLTEQVFEPGAVWTVLPGVVHQEEAVTDCVEIEAGDPTLDDRVRMEQVYGFAPDGGLPSMTPLQAAQHLAGLGTAFLARGWDCQDWAREISKRSVILPKPAGLPAR